MSVTNITAAFVKIAKCPAEKPKSEYFDRKFNGFMLEVRASGGKTFYQRYQDAHGRKKQFRIGPADIMPLKLARQKAKEILISVHMGEDPQVARQEKRKTLLFRALVHEYYLPHARQHKRSWKTDVTILENHLLPAFGKQPIDAVTTQDVHKLVEKKQADGYAPGTINRIVVLLRYIYNLAEKWDMAGAQANPTRGISLFRTEHRERYLDQEEAKALIAACEEDENFIASRAIILLLLTGARRNEITHARWEYVNWEHETLYVPLSKSGKPRTIELTRRGMELLKELPRDGYNPYIFPSPATGRPSPSLFYPWRRICKRAGLEEVRLHDLRHSFASFLVNSGSSLYVVQRLLGHTQYSTTQRYAHLAPQTTQTAASMVGDLIESGVGRA